MRMSKRFAKLSARIERLLVKAAIVFAVLLVLFQLALRSPELRASIVRVELLEGIKYEESKW